MFQSRLAGWDLLSLFLSLLVPFVTIHWKLERLARHCRASAEGVHPPTRGLPAMQSGKRAGSGRIHCERVTACDGTSSLQTHAQMVVFSLFVRGEQGMGARLLWPGLI